MLKCRIKTKKPSYLLFKNVKDSTNDEKGNPLPQFHELHFYNQHQVTIRLDRTIYTTDFVTSGGPIELFLVPASTPRLVYQGRYPVYGMVHIKEPLLLIGKSSPCGSSGFPLSLSEWSFTICLTPCNRE